MGGTFHHMRDDPERSIAMKPLRLPWREPQEIDLPRDPFLLHHIIELFLDAFFFFFLAPFFAVFLAALRFLATSITSFLAEIVHLGLRLSKEFFQYTHNFSAGSTERCTTREQSPIAKQNENERRRSSSFPIILIVETSSDVL